MFYSVLDLVRFEIWFQGIQFASELGYILLFIHLKWMLYVHGEQLSSCLEGQLLHYIISEKAS